VDLGLDSRAFLITGGSDGLGLALASTLIAEGANVAICGRDPSRLEEASRRLGSSALCVRADVTSSEELSAFVDATIGRFGRLDGAVSNAGQASGRSIVDSSDDEWRADYELKVMPAVLLARRCADELAKAGGSILNVLTIKAKAPDAGSTPTAASRAAGLALTKAVSAELGPRGVRANAILVGLIESGQWVRRARDLNMDLDEFYRTVAANQPIALGRFGRAEEFASLAAFILSPRASYLTGAGINLDGGLSPVS
jgi:NAD(P)-dependent dehydrogenase (short-subunit alcohol dehydrogenase family)